MGSVAFLCPQKATFGPEEKHNRTTRACFGVPATNQGVRSGTHRLPVRLDTNARRRGGDVAVDGPLRRARGFSKLARETGRGRVALLNSGVESLQ